MFLFDLLINGLNPKEDVIGKLSGYFEKKMKLSSGLIAAPLGFEKNKQMKCSNSGRNAAPFSL